MSEQPTEPTVLPRNAILDLEAFKERLVETVEFYFEAETVLDVPNGMPPFDAYIEGFIVTIHPDLHTDTNLEELYATAKAAHRLFTEPTDARVH